MSQTVVPEDSDPTVAAQGVNLPTDASGVYSAEHDDVRAVSVDTDERQADATRSNTQRSGGQSVQLGSPFPWGVPQQTGWGNWFQPPLVMSPFMGDIGGIKMLQPQQGGQAHPPPWATSWALLRVPKSKGVGLLKQGKGPALHMVT